MGVNLHKWVRAFLHESDWRITMKLRMYQQEDLEEVVQLFYETIRTVNRKDYSEEQVEVWASRCGYLRENSTFFERLYTIVATEGKRIIGYGNIDETGYLDHLYVHKDFQSQGVATAICDELERHAKERQIVKIRVHVSVTAKPFFEKRGYTVEQEQKVELDGVKLTNYKMEKMCNN